MPVINRIALCGGGRVDRILFAGADALSFAKTIQKEYAFDSDMLLKILESTDYTLLVKAYKKTQRKYYPEKDVFTNNFMNNDKKGV